MGPVLVEGACTQVRGMSHSVTPTQRRKVQDSNGEVDSLFFGRVRVCMAVESTPKEHLEYSQNMCIFLKAFKDLLIILL